MSLITLWSAKTPDLKTFQWKNRLLLVFAPSAADPEVQKQRSLVEEKSSGFHDRDLLVFILAEQKGGEKALETQFRIRPKSFTVLLIGKDGTEKLRQDSVIQPEKLFRVVDSMPMRRAGER
jgi:hypothetical protein